ncbi:DUF2179 domain-containing protein [Marinilabiliaceae bacterium ANBcel2]|nr:DUF2179 domain-containing protein [Marinilabiliaceae bacterium ANBcel2]
MEFADSAFYTWVLLPFLIFIARVADVAIGTVRIVFVSKGLKLLAPVLGFFEIFIWLLAMGAIFENLDNWFYYVAYSGGFGVGTLVGLLIEDRLAIGFINMRIITTTPGDALIKRLSNEGFGVTETQAHGSRGKVNIIYCIIKRSDYQKVAAIVEEYNPKAFHTIEEVKFAKEGVFPMRAITKNPGFTPMKDDK